jgi:hypothetical protein
MTRIASVVVPLVILFGFVKSLPAEIPDFYKHVAGLIWVVDDLEAVTRGWERLGFPAIQQHGVVQLQDSKFHGKETQVSVQAATGHLGQVKIDWLQPVSEGNAFSEFLAENGPGVFALVHNVPFPQVIELELVRFESLGVGPLQTGASGGVLSWGLYAFMDTRAQGKYVLGLMSRPEVPQAPVFSQESPFTQSIAQYAFAVQNPLPVSEFWEGVGLPPFSIVPVDGRDQEYKGKPSDFEMELGWQRHGDVSYEWCIPLKGPTVYQDHIEEYGEGFHHLGLRVRDLDKTIQKWEELGVAVIQSGAWGEKGKRGSGRYAYMDTYPIGGIAVELLWSFQE